FDESPMSPRKVFQLFGAHRMNATPWFCRPVPEADGDESARLEKRDQLSEGPPSVGWWNVHPHGAQQDKVEGEPESEGLLKTREPVVNPTDSRVRMASMPLCTHSG